VISSGEIPLIGNTRCWHGRYQPRSYRWHFSGLYLWSGRASVGGRPRSILADGPAERGSDVRLAIPPAKLRDWGEGQGAPGGTIQSWAHLTPEISAGLIRGMARGSGG